MAQHRDFRSQSILECSDCEEIAPGSQLSTTIKEYRNGYVKVEVGGKGEGWVVFSESGLPGWEAFVDGEPVPIHTANYLFQAVHVGKGAHVVEFRYGADLLHRAIKKLL